MGFYKSDYLLCVRPKYKKAFEKIFGQAHKQQLHGLINMIQLYRKSIKRKIIVLSFLISLQPRYFSISSNLLELFVLGHVHLQRVSSTIMLMPSTLFVPIENIV